MHQQTDIAIVGGGAAGLMSAIWAGRTAAGALRIVVLDGAAKLGAKILIAGGGRCNVTHDVVDERAYAGSSPAAIRKVLRRFDVKHTISFFRELGVELKREPTGKLFPVTDQARTVLQALIGACREAGVELVHPWRVQSIDPAGEDGFRIEGRSGTITARRVICATGGMSLPKTGSDGHGYTIVRALGHSITERVFPALVPLTLPRDHFLCRLRGIALPAQVEVRTANDKRLTSFNDSLLFTHFGISGPAVLDVSRYYLNAHADDPGAKLMVNWLPQLDFAGADALLLEPGRGGVANLLAAHLPRRLAEELCRENSIDPAADRRALSRDQRRALAHALVEMELPVTGDRGFTFAEVTAGGVPLAELHLDTLESRKQPGLHLCGEICDVDGRIGGFNFQWAWAGGYVAGKACAEAALHGDTGT